MVNFKDFYLTNEGILKTLGGAIKAGAKGLATVAAAPLIAKQGMERAANKMQGFAQNPLGSIWGQKDTNTKVPATTAADTTQTADTANNPYITNNPYGTGDKSKTAPNNDTITYGGEEYYIADTKQKNNWVGGKKTAAYELTLGNLTNTNKPGKYSNNKINPASDPNVAKAPPATQQQSAAQPAAKPRAAHAPKQQSAARPRVQKQSKNNQVAAQPQIKITPEFQTQLNNLLVQQGNNQADAQKINAEIVKVINNYKPTNK